MGLEQQIGELIGEIRGWEIPEFKTEVFQRLRCVEEKVTKMNGGRIEKVEDRVDVLEDSQSEKRGMWKLMIIFGTILSGTGIIGVLLGKYLLGGQ